MPIRQRDASMHRPYGLIRPKAAVLGAAKRQEKLFHVGWAILLTIDFHHA